MNRERKITPLGQLRYALEAAGFFSIISFFRLCPLDRASAVGGWIGRNIFKKLQSTRARENLRAAYPNENESEIDRIVTAMWDNLGRVLAEYGHFAEFRLNGSAPRIEITGLENLKAAHAMGKGMLMISAHFANWEILPFAARQLGIVGAAVVRPTNNPIVARWLDGERTRHGMPEQISKGARGTRRIFSLLRKGETTMMLVDQRAGEGIPAPFFGRDAMTTPAPAALALKLGAPILPVWNERLGGSHFRITVFPPIIPKPTGDEGRDTMALTARINRWVEERVRARPEQWLWIHRRWSEPGAKMKKRAQALVGAGKRVESEGSSLT